MHLVLIMFQSTTSMVMWERLIHLTTPFPGKITHRESGEGALQ